MSQQPTVWIITEGASNDRPFYGNLARQLVGKHSYAVDTYLVEDIELEGQAPGGKSGVIALLAHYDESGSLTQSNRRHTSLISFAADRDHDGFVDDLYSHSHLLFLESRDVEGEIYLRADVPRAVEASWGIDRSSLAPILAQLSDLHHVLVSLWQPWIELGYAASSIRGNFGLRFANISAINQSSWGPVDESAQSAVEAKLTNACDVPFSGRHALESAQNYVRGLSASGLHHQLLKGKWLAGFTAALVRSATNGTTVRANVRDEAVTSACLATIDFTGDWTERYEAYFEALIRLPNQKRKA